MHLVAADLAVNLLTVVEKASESAHERPQVAQISAD
jgi:hypothetical protein